MTRTPTDKHIATLARVIFGCYFMYSALRDMKNFTEIVTTTSIPATAFFLVIAIIIKFFFGAMLAMRYHTKYVCLFLAAYLILVSLILHNPLQWKGNELSELIFMRNLAIICGLLFIYSHSRGYTQWKQRSEPY